MVRRSIWIFWPSFISETCSVGITIWRTLRCWPSETTRCSRFCLTLFSCPEYVLTAYQRNIVFASRLEDFLDELREDRVQPAQVGTDDQHEEENDPRELGELPAVRPLDALKLRPHRHEEREKPTALVGVRAFTPAPHAARPSSSGLLRVAVVVVGEVLVVDGEARRRGLVAERPVAAADVLGRGGPLPVGEVEGIGIALPVVDARLVGPAAEGRFLATLRLPLLTALLLASLRT